MKKTKPKRDKKRQPHPMKVFWMVNGKELFPDSKAKSFSTAISRTVLANFKQNMLQKFGHVRDDVTGEYPDLIISVPDTSANIGQVQISFRTDSETLRDKIAGMGMKVAPLDTVVSEAPESAVVDEDLGKAA